MKKKHSNQTERATYKELLKQFEELKAAVEFLEDRTKMGKIRAAYRDTNRDAERLSIALLFILEWSTADKHGKSSTRFFYHSKSDLVILGAYLCSQGYPFGEAGPAANIKASCLPTLRRLTKTFCVAMASNPSASQRLFMEVVLPQTDFCLEFKDTLAMDVLTQLATRGWIGEQTDLVYSELNYCGSVSHEISTTLRDSGVKLSRARGGGRGKEADMALSIIDRLAGRPGSVPIKINGYIVNPESRLQALADNETFLREKGEDCTKYIEKERAKILESRYEALYVWRMSSLQGSKRFGIGVEWGCLEGHELPAPTRALFIFDRADDGSVDDNLPASLVMWYTKGWLRAVIEISTDHLAVLLDTHEREPLPGSAWFGCLEAYDDVSAFMADFAERKACRGKAILLQDVSPKLAELLYLPFRHLEEFLLSADHPIVSFDSFIVDTFMPISQYERLEEPPQWPEQPLPNVLVKLPDRDPYIWAPTATLLDTPIPYLFNEDMLKRVTYDDESETDDESVTGYAECIVDRPAVVCFDPELTANGDMTVDPKVVYPEVYEGGRLMLDGVEYVLYPDLSKVVPEYLAIALYKKAHVVVGEQFTYIPLDSEGEDFSSSGLYFTVPGLYAPELGVTKSSLNLRNIFMSLPPMEVQRRIVAEFREERFEYERRRYETRVKAIMEDFDEYRIVSVLAHNMLNKLDPLKSTVGRLQRATERQGLADTPLHDRTRTTFHESFESASGYLELTVGAIRAAQEVASRPIKREDFKYVEVLDLLHERLGKLEHVDYDLQISGDRASIALHPDIFIEAVYNLVQNAKVHGFVGDGPHWLKVTTSVDTANERLSIRFCNSGKPFSKSIRPQDFRLLGKKSKSSTGFGIGGAWVDRFLRSHGGSLDIRYPDEGADLTINLPLTITRETDNEHEA